MESKERRSMNYYMRSLHRDIGFFVIGLTIIYTLSGILLIYRDSDFLKHKVITEREIKPNLNESDLGMVLHLKDFKVLKSEGDILYFQNGTYNKSTGLVKYKEKVLPSVFTSSIKMHKISSQSATRWISIVYGLLLLFLAISSFWMYKSKTKLFRRGIYITAVGFISALILLII